jgi:hypothetical protein
MPRQDRNDHEVIHLKFAAKECLACPVRSQCTHAVKEPRSIMIRAEPTYDVLQHARQRQQTLAFKELYAKRAGIEGTLSEARAGVWTPTISLCGRSENTLTNVHDSSRHQCRSHWGLDRGTTTRANPSLSFCCPGTNWVMDVARMRQQNLCKGGLPVVLQKIRGDTMGVKPHLLLSLGGHSKDAGDEGDLPQDVPFFHATYLPFPHYVHDLISL